jgi:DMSO/TMAO reductase YedYZ molybdopterin-dependent catalytic subunit
VPINKSAAAAGVLSTATSAAYRLTVRHGDRAESFSLADLRAMRQTTASLPIACVEGWSAGATWTGVPVRDLLDRVGASRGREVTVTSLQPSAPTGSPRCRRTSPTTRGPSSRSSSVASRCRSTTASRAD